MPATANGGRSGNTKKKDTTMMDNFKGACPPHKIRDLDKLVKQMKGDEAKIMERIQEWWEEPVNPEEEEKWEDVNKKTLKKKQEQGGPSGGGRGGRGGRAGGGTGGRSGRGRDRGGGRADRAGRDRQGRGPRGDKRQTDPSAPKQTTDQDPASPTGVPAPSNAPALKGAWGARAAAAVPPVQEPPGPAEKSLPVEGQEPMAPPPTSVPEINPLDTVQVNQLPLPPIKTAIESNPPPRTSVRSGGNVWATKGSAHLIQAEKQPPVPATPPAPVAKHSQPNVVEQESSSFPIPDSNQAPTLETGLPSGVSAGSNAWSQSPQPTQPAPVPTPQPIEMPPPPSPAVSRSIAPPSPAGLPPPETAIPDPVSTTPAAASPAVQKVLNMGHWETGGGDDPSDIDFGFGFGAGSNDATAPPPAPKEAVSASNAAAASPARPPPGLSISGMPPMPASAVMVHELENKLESASLNAPTSNDNVPPSAPIPASLTQTQPYNSMPNQALPSGITQQSYGQQQYGMPGMYNYNASGAPTGFIGMPGPVLTGGVMPQQPGKPQGASSLAGPVQTVAPNLAQPGLYGAQTLSTSQSQNPSSDSVTNAESAASGTAPSSAVPPGMPGAIPYANPALHYGQHQFYMGQHQGGIGYNYGYGQFGGVAQGGFGYQPSMGHNQGYGGPHYDDQGHQGNSHHSGGAGGYPNKGSGYRGRNTHHNNNQYQNQYNPQQHSGYGGQPYGMGYHGHGPGGMGDPYGMQHQGGMGGGSFQDEDHQKGRKGARGGNSSFQQGPSQLGGQQSFGLQQQGGVDSAPSSGGGGWSNQGGGWSGGGQSTGWQGN
ncbi:hypothetical protein IV203_035472 [Nitzschia inconspicua]|uniref:Uncharacterized protein n=1 Tax=Nitzschia inconspicua TaxID=303405 RepID=A0A9K3PUU0_9STRA|nr:hypothetical protein IV203_035472 [Nitzschia inconspicua]